MTSEYNLSVFLVIVLFQGLVQGRGVLILYRPKDITDDCVNSFKLRYDLSFGMGMSDTITLVFKTIPNLDYECEVDINTDAFQTVYVVLRFPNPVGYNCDVNYKAFHVMQRKDCFPVCDLLEDTNLFSNYWTIVKKGRFRFQYRSNSNINTDMNALWYEVTVTTARQKTKSMPCFKNNETECFDQRSNEYYCMTNGIVCDGIRNCGVEDWYDERKADCDVSSKNLGFPPLLTVLTIIVSVILTGVVVVRRCLPKVTSFFIFSSSRDNRLATNPIFRKPDPSSYEATEGFLRKKSVTPADWSSSSTTDSEDDKKTYDMDIPSVSSSYMPEGKDVGLNRKHTTSFGKIMSSIIEQRFQSVVGLSRHFVRQSEHDRKPSTRPSTSGHKY